MLSCILSCMCVSVHAQSCQTLCNSLVCSTPGFSYSWYFPDKDTWLVCHFYSRYWGAYIFSNESFSCFFFPDIYPSVIAGSYDSLYLIVGGTPIMFSIVVALIYIPTKSILWLSFSTPSTTLILCLFYNKHDDSYKVFSLWKLICISLMISF